MIKYRKEELPNAGTISLDDGKYKFVLNEQGMLVQALRNDEDWPPGMEYQFSKAIMCMLWRIQELENEPFLPSLAND